MGLAATIAERLGAKRSRLLPLLTVGAVLLIASRLSGAVPREVSLRYDLGPEHGTVTEARIGYHRDGEEIQTVRFAYARGAPSVLAHRVSLSPGRYEVVADVLGSGTSRSVVRSLVVPAEGVVRMRLFDASPPISAPAGAVD